MGPWDVDELQTVLGMKTTLSQSELIDHIDMMADEFKRIKALHHGDTETASLCDRAVSYIKQHVPVIEQRDRLEAARAKDAELIQRLVDTLQHVADAGTWSPDISEAIAAADAHGFKPSQQ